MWDQGHQRNKVWSVGLGDQYPGFFKCTHGIERQKFAALQQDLYLTIRTRRNVHRTYQSLSGDLFSATIARISFHTARRRWTEEDRWHQQRPLRIPGLSIKLEDLNVFGFTSHVPRLIRIIVSSQMSLSVYQDSKISSVARRPGGWYNPSLVLPVYPFGRTSITVWAGISSAFNRASCVAKWNYAYSVLSR